MSEQTLTNPTPFAFIPRPLDVEDKPELSVLPLNVLFVSFANINGVDTKAAALYEPSFSSYFTRKHTQYMRYYNKYSEVDYIDITYRYDNWNYVGLKYVKGAEVHSAYGKDWKTFFVHLTMAGLAKNEGCLFEPLEPQG